MNRVTHLTAGDDVLTLTVVILTIIFTSVSWKWRGNSSL